MQPKVASTNASSWMRQAGRLLAFGAVLAGLYVAIDTVLIVIRTYSALPYWDQWDSLMDYQLWRKGVASLHLLFEFHNEHRLALPRLIFLADYEWAAGTNRLNLSLVSLIQLIHVALLLSLIRRWWQEAGAWVAAAAVLALMMSLGQWQNFTWGFQSQFVGVFALSTGAFLLVAKAADQTGRRRVALFIGALALLFLAAFTMANGMAAAAVAIVLCLVIGAPWWMPAGLAACLAATAMFYFHDYHAATGSSLHELLSDPLRLVAYGLSYLGNPLGEPLLWDVEGAPARVYPAASLLGIVGAVLSAAVGCRVLLRRDGDRGQAVLAAVIVLVLISVALTAAGRIGFGLEQAYASRYRTTAGLFWAAQILFWYRATRRPWSRMTVMAGSVFALAAMVWLQQAVKPDVFEDAAGRRSAESALLGDVRDIRALEGAFPQSGRVWERTPLLRTYRKSIFAEPRAAWTGRSLAQMGPVRTDRCLGAFDGVVRSPYGARYGLRATGWAWDRKGFRPVRDIVLTDDANRIVGVGRTGLRRPDVRAALYLPWAGGAGWQVVGQTKGRSLRAFGVLQDGVLCALGEKSLSTLPPVDAPRQL